MGRVGITRTSWGELDRAEAAGPSWTELLRRVKVTYGEPERDGATQLKKGRAGLTQSNREEGELGVMGGRLSLIHKPSVGIALQGNSRHTAPGGRYVTKIRAKYQTSYLADLETGCVFFCLCPHAVLMKV